MMNCNRGFRCRTSCPTVFSVTYNPNGGIGGRVEANLRENTPYTIKSAAQAGVSLLGATLSSWNTESGGGGTEYLPGQVINMTQNLILYAQWEPFIP